MRFLIALGWLIGRLHGCTLVEGDRILGENLAAEHSSFVGVDPRADVGPAPVAGTRRTFRYFELGRIAKEHSVTLTPDDPHEACFERSTVHLDRETLGAALRASIHVPDLEVLDFSRNALPSGRAEFRSEGLSSSGLWRGKWLYGENRSVPIWARVKSSSGAIPLRTPAEHRVARGEPVRVEVRSGGVVLAFDAATESSGHVGEQVTVQNPANGQRFRAVVRGPGRVEILK
jgi:hypothetical protein